jgi:3-phenylpropionate/trans-cinnamate dioxygenase ferredoxin reductase component
MSFAFESEILFAPRNTIHQGNNAKEKIMPNYRYLIVGGGMTADAAVRGIREVDGEGTIGLVSAEPHAPYDRPPLTKSLWKGKSPESIWRTAAAQESALHLGCRVVEIDPWKKCVRDHHGLTYRYQKLLLATGGTPRRLPADCDSILYFRTLDDYRHLRLLAEKKRRFAVVGGGFIGSEIAAALAQNGKQVVMIFPEDGIGGRMFSADLAGFLNDYYREKGVEVRGGAEVVAVEKRAEQFLLKTRNRQDGREEEIVADAVVAGLGIEPNVELARLVGLTVGNGIQVAADLRTSDPDIYAAGDVAEFFNPALGKRLRVEHEDNANTMGEMAGRSMAGQLIDYDHLPFFYSDLFDVGYEAVGDVDSRLETVADWKEPYHEGVVYYLRDGRVAGVLLWNVWERVEAARALIAEPGPIRADELHGRLIDVHQHA